MAHTDFHGVTEQTKAGRARLADALVLKNNARCRGAAYLAGYAVECALKAKLTRMYGCFNLRELADELQRRKVLDLEQFVFTHQLEILLGLAQALDRLRGNAKLWSTFNLVNRWMPAWRYAPDNFGPDDAEEFLAAVQEVLRWVETNA